jgi:hypothetical protein
MNLTLYLSRVRSSDLLAATGLLAIVIGPCHL